MSEAPRQAIEQYDDLAAELGLDPGDVGLAWLLHQPTLSAPIIGSRTIDQLDAGACALDMKPDATPWVASTRSSPGARTPLSTTPGNPQTTPKEHTC